MHMHTPNMYSLDPSLFLFWNPKLYLNVELKL